MQSTGRDVPPGLQPDYYLAQETIVSFAELEPCNDAGMDIQQMARELLESQRELGTAESLVRDLARKIDQMVIDADRVNGSTGYYVPKSELMCLLSHVPKELR